MTTYSVYLNNALGVRLADASNFVSLKYARVVNDVGTLTLTLPGTFPTQYIANPDGRIEVWRRLDNGREYLDMETVWLIKSVTQATNARGLTTIVVEADTPLCLLREPGRFVSYADDTSQATKAAAAADDQIKAYVTQNMGSTATGSRNISTYVSIAANLSQGASVAKAAAWRDLLKVCQELADASATAGTYVAFDIVAPTPSTLEFRTYTGQRGVDHRWPSGMNPVLLSPDLGNLGEIELTLDYRKEVTYVLAAGNGPASSRVTSFAQDTVRQGASPFGYRELFVDANTGDTTTLTAEANAALRDGRARRIFKGRILETNDTQYGVHWAWGDFVTAQAFGQVIDCRIEAVTVSVSAGGSYETIDAWLKSDS